MPLIDDLKNKAKEKSMTQEKLAHELGVAVSTISHWYKGRFQPSKHIQEKIEHFINKK